LQLAGRFDPRDQTSVAGRRGRKLGVGQVTTDGVDHGRVMGVAVGVDAGCDGLRET
jgi:hypothetical protein